MINNFEGYRTFNHIPAMDEDALVGIGLEQNDRYMREKRSTRPKKFRIKRS